MERKMSSRDEYLYHNTEKLLKKYRDIVWSIEVETLQAEKDFEKEMKYSIREFLNMPYTAMEDLKGAKVKKQMKTLARNNWIDADGKVYIYFKLKDAQDCLGIGKDKCIKLFTELDKGIGLIERKKTGFEKAYNDLCEEF